SPSLYRLLFFFMHPPTPPSYPLSLHDALPILNLHPISILDRASQGTEYSTRAANAAYCVADEDGEAAYTFIDLLFRNQPAEATRSEEHTSELQSRFDLVCRLLLEKKKQKNKS